VAIAAPVRSNTLRLGERGSADDEAFPKSDVSTWVEVSITSVMASLRKVLVAPLLAEITSLLLKFYSRQDASSPPDLRRA